MGDKPSVPTYNVGQAKSEQNRINQAAGNQYYANVVSPTGGYTTTVDPNTGQITVNKTLGQNSNAALGAQYSALSNYSGDPSEAAKAYYDSQMTYLQPAFDRQVERAEASLTNRGIPLGSKAWNDAMGDIYDAQNQQMSALSSNSLLAGQQYQQNILNQAATAGGQVIDPTMVSGQAGAGLSDTYDKQFANTIEKYKNDVANYNNKWGTITNLGGQLLGTAMGALI